MKNKRYKMDKEVIKKIMKKSNVRIIGLGEKEKVIRNFLQVIEIYASFQRRERGFWEKDKNTLDNLRPICKTCNRSMGTMNLEEFKKEFH